LAQDNQLCKRIALPEVIDDRGHLMFAEVGHHIPFEIRRIFTLYRVSPGMERADHAHRSNHQFLIMLVGRCRIVFDDGRRIGSEDFDSPKEGLYVPPLVWITLKEFSDDAVCLVLASEPYAAAEYIRDAREFRELTAARRQ
jgi:dTDP-4-dehydrorhamnose 3,5-epimerase-like enzyme